MDRDDSPADGALVERLARCYTGVVHDVLRARGLANFVLPSSIVPLDLAMVAAGPVFTVRGRPGRYSSVSPSIRSFAKRLRHLPTVCSCTPSRSATSLL